MLDVTKHCLFADREQSNKVELLVFSATKGRDSFYRDPRQCQSPVAFLPVTPQILELSNFSTDLHINNLHNKHFKYILACCGFFKDTQAASKLQALSKQS